jgi:hypothetical protein
MLIFRGGVRFPPGGRREAEAYIDGLVAKDETISNERFLLATLRSAAFSRNAHASTHGGVSLPATPGLRLKRYIGGTGRRHFVAPAQAWAYLRGTDRRLLVAPA